MGMCFGQWNVSGVLACIPETTIKEALQLPLSHIILLHQPYVCVSYPSPSDPAQASLLDYEEHGGREVRTWNPS